MLEVKQAEYAGNYAVRLVFSNGRAGTANLEQLVFNDRRPIFARLREQANFSSFKLAHSTVIWNDELDIAPEYLFYLACKDDQDLQEQFRQWGYIQQRDADTSGPNQFGVAHDGTVDRNACQDRFALR